MIKIIPWNTVCGHCNTKLSYENEDIINEFVRGEGSRGYIICPKCNKKVIIL